MSAEGFLFSGAVLGLVAIFRFTRLGCFVGVHGRAGDWQETGEEPDERGYIHIARRCERCGGDVERLPLRKRGPVANGILYVPE